MSATFHLSTVYSLQLGGKTLTPRGELCCCVICLDCLAEWSDYLVNKSRKGQRFDTDLAVQPPPLVPCPLMAQIDLNGGFSHPVLLLLAPFMWSIMSVSAWPLRQNEGERTATCSQMVQRNEDSIRLTDPSPAFWKGVICFNLIVLSWSIIWFFFLPTCGSSLVCPLANNLTCTCMHILLDCSEIFESIVFIGTFWGVGVVGGCTDHLQHWLQCREYSESLDFEHGCPFSRLFVPSCSLPITC